MGILIIEKLVLPMATFVIGLICGILCMLIPPKKTNAEVAEPAEEEDPDPIIQHVGYSDAECGREK